MTHALRPMLAAQKYRKPADLWTPAHEKVVLQHIREDGHLILQPKIDGFRVMCYEGIGYSRSWTPWTNRYLQQFIRDNAELTCGWDGEMVPGLEYDATSFRHAMSGLRSEDGANEFTYFLFDNCDPSWAKCGYTERYETLEKDLNGCHMVVYLGDTYKAKVVIVPNYHVTSLEEIYHLEKVFLEQGWEGAMVKRPHSRYKYGRATAVGGECTKVKRFKDFEAVVVGYTEAMENQNELTTSALGYAKRSSHLENLVGKGYLGAFQCYRLGGNPSDTFRVGVFKGWSHEDRRKLWAIRDQLPGRIITCSEQAVTGGYDAARTPVFSCFRDPIDL